MAAWRWVNVVVLGLWAVESLLLKLGWVVLTLWWGKLWAVRSYRRELIRAGLPHSAVRELVASYDIALGDLVRLGWKERSRLLSVRR